MGCTKLPKEFKTKFIALKNVLLFFEHLVIPSKCVSQHEALLVVVVVVVVLVVVIVCHPVQL